MLFGLKGLSGLEYFVQSVVWMLKEYPWLICYWGYILWVIYWDIGWVMRKVDFCTGSPLIVEVRRKGSTTVHDMDSCCLKGKMYKEFEQ